MAILGARTLWVQRKPGVYVDGVWTGSGGEERFSIRGSLQPISGRELQLLPEGERTREQFKLYTKAELLTSRDSAAAPTKADMVEHRGRLLKVMAEIPWTDHRAGVPHRKYRLTGPGEDGR